MYKINWSKTYTCQIFGEQSNDYQYKITINIILLKASHFPRSVLYTPAVLLHWSPSTSLTLAIKACSTYIICPCVRNKAHQMCFHVCVLIFTWNDCLRELSAAIPETDLVIVINQQTLNNKVSASLRTLFITLFVIYLKHYFATKRIIIHKYYRI